MRGRTDRAASKRSQQHQRSPAEGTKEGLRSRHPGTHTGCSETSDDQPDDTECDERGVGRLRPRAEAKQERSSDPR